MMYITPGTLNEEIREFPDLFVSKSKRESKKYIKSLNDFFANEARRQYGINLKTFVRNYSFMKGKLTAEDFYEAMEDPMVNNFMDEMDYDLERDGLPTDVVHYSILNQPINTLLGELSNKPDNKFVKAFDEQSQSEQLETLTKIVENLMYSQVRDKWMVYFVEQGMDMNSDEFMQNVEQQTVKETSDKISSFTSLAERWGNRMLDVLKVQFNLKEKSEDTFADLLKTGRERYHIYEDNSPTGFSVSNLNPRNCFRIQGSEGKYTDKDIATGVIEIMDISEIINRFKLTKKDVDDLREGRKGFVGNKNTSTGMYSISYSPRIDPYLEQVRNLEDFSIFRNEYDMYDDFLQSGRYWHGDRYQVVTTYVQAKETIGKLTYINSEGIETVDFVGEDYKSGDHIGEIDLEWRYYNKWYKAVNIANILYSYEPVEFIDRNPIIGGDFDPRNSEVKGLIDLAKPFQMIYTLAVNQLWRLLQKEIGVAYSINPRKIPVAEDGTHKDALDQWEYVLREKGLVMEDDSPENMGTPNPQAAASKPIDLTRTNEIQSRYTIAQQMKAECWELLGITRERLGSVAASQTASGANMSLSQSYAQTAPWFTHHYYILNDLYQAMLDAAQYYESQKEESTLSFVSGTAENIFIKVAGKELKGRDLRVFVTDRVEDFEHLQFVKSFTNEMIQNGVHPYDALLLRGSKSIREHEDALRKSKERQEEMQQQQMQIEQQRNEELARQTQVMQEIEVARIENENMNKAADRKNKIDVAVIQTYARQQNNTIDSDGDGVPDIHEIMNESRESVRLQQDYDIKRQQQAQQLAVDTAKIASNNREIEIQNQQHKEKMKQLEEDRRSRERLKKVDSDISKRNKN